jgi:hypothetical protein
MVHLLLDNIRSRQFHYLRRTSLEFKFLIFLAISVFNWFLFRLSRSGWVGSFKLLEEEMLGAIPFLLAALSVNGGWLFWVRV